MKQILIVLTIPDKVETETILKDIKDEIKSNLTSINDWEHIVISVFEIKNIE